MRPLALLALILLFVFTVAPVSAQNSQVNFSFDSLLHLGSARKFPYCGKLDLAQNFPNPFSTADETEIRYKAIDATSAAIIVYSLDGKQILTHRLDSAVGRLFIKGSDFAAGIYIYALMVNGRLIAKRKFIVQLE